MVSHVASLISTVCDTLEEYFLDQFSPWKIITVSCHHCYCKSEDNWGKYIKIQPQPTSLSDSTLKNLHTFLFLSVYIAIHSITPISFWQQMAAGHFLVICWGKIPRIFTWWKRLYAQCLFKKSAFSAFPPSFASWKMHFHATPHFWSFFIVPLTWLIAHFAAGFRSVLAGNCRYHVNKYGKQNSTNKQGMPAQR